MKSKKMTLIVGLVIMTLLSATYVFADCSAGVSVRTSVRDPEILEISGRFCPPNDKSTDGTSISCGFLSYDSWDDDANYVECSFRAEDGQYGYFGSSSGSVLNAIKAAWAYGSMWIRVKDHKIIEARMYRF